MKGGQLLATLVGGTGKTQINRKFEKQRRSTMTTKNKKKKDAANSGDGPVISLGIDFGNHPYFVKKAAKSKEHLEKSGFPEDLVPKRK
jgi:hypothetical protein